MKNMKRVAALVMAVLFMGVGVLSNVGTISQVEAAPKISVKKKTLNQGSSVTLKVTGGKGTIKWSVNNSNVKISKKTGTSTKVTAVKAGTSKVTAKVGSKKLVSTIKVNGLNIVKKDLNEGASFTVKAVGLGKKIKWSVNKNYVKISKKSGTSTKVTAVKKGTAVVTAKVGKKSYKCTVTVKHVHKPVALAGKAATCTTAGLTAGTKCSACGQIITAQKTIPALGHKEVKIDGKAATCYEAGLTEGTSCSVCKVVIKAQTEIPALAHSNKVHQEAVAAGCHSLGHVEYWFCPDCEGFWTDEACTRVTNSKSIILPATGSENLTHVPAVAPTATENGNVEYWYCPDCEGFWLDEACTRLTNSKSVILPATGEPETPVEGSQENPIPVTDLEMNVTIPAGATVWYQGRIAGMILSAEGTDMFSVEHNGEIYETPSYWYGVEVGPLVGMGTTSFAITNMGEAQDIILTFSYPYGSSMNPSELYGLESVYTMLPAAGMMDAYEGYFYTYTPEADETVNLVIQEIEDGVVAEVDIMITMDTPEGGTVSYSLLADGVDGVLTVDFKAGVTATINVAAMPDRTWNRPAVNLFWGKPFGTEDNPLGLDELATNLEVAAGASYYLQSQMVAGNTLEITGGDVTVTVDGVEYQSVDGKVTIAVPASAGHFAPPTQIVITNNGSEAVTYAINVILPVGIYDNPEVVTDLSSFSAELREAGMMDFYQGYFFKYVATEDGVISLEVKNIVSSAADATADIIITNNSTYEQKSLQWDGVEGVVSIDVSAGDEIMINLQMVPGADYVSPAATVTVGTPTEGNLDTDVDDDLGYGDIF